MKNIFLGIALFLAAVSAHGQTSYNVLLNVQGLTSPVSTLNDTLLLDYSSPAGIYADIIVNDNFAGSGWISFANTPVDEEATAYLLGGELVSQRVGYDSQGRPSSWSASFDVLDSSGVEHTIQLNWTFTYSTIRVNRYITRQARSVYGEVIVEN